MFHYIRGRVAMLDAGLAVLDCHGLGFALNVSGNTLSRLKIGEDATLFVREAIREDAFDLFGFAQAEERRFFDMLLGVSGVGPKAAISILSAATPEALAMAIISGNEKALTLAPGIGKKIAQRVLLELKDKVSKELGGTALDLGGGVSGGTVGVSKLADAASALAVLGYGNAEISAALKDVDMESMTLEEIIRGALKRMVK
jgi:Holliday junction DNA helicase RuvA